MRLLFKMRQNVHISWFCQFETNRHIFVQVIAQKNFNRAHFMLMIMSPSCMTRVVCYLIDVVLLTSSGEIVNYFFHFAKDMLFRRPISNDWHVFRSWGGFCFIFLFTNKMMSKNYACRIVIHKKIKFWQPITCFVAYHLLRNLWRLK